MELFVYKGEFQLPSIDLDCLRVLVSALSCGVFVNLIYEKCDLNFQMYMKLADIQGIKVRTDCSPFHSDNSFLPYLVDLSDKKKYCGYEKITNFLKREGYTLDSSEKNEAYLSYIAQNLYPFFMYQMFGNPQNIDDTRALYALRTPFPFNFYYPSRYMRRTEQVCQTVANFSLEEPITAHDTVEMETTAKRCLNWISDRLSNNEFFINGAQNEVDATIFAYLAIILKFQLPNNQLQAHASQCENLVRYVDNLKKKFFTDDECFESDKVKAQSQKKEQKVFTGQEDEDPPSEVKKRYVLSGLFASVVMLSYGYITGIFSVMLFKINPN
jgi:metaxin